MYALERACFWPPLETRLYSPRFSEDAAVCDGCGVCVRACPLRNITQRERRAVPAWGRDCLACLEFALRCPVGAVRSPADWRVFTPFVACNVRRGRIVEV